MSQVFKCSTYCYKLVKVFLLEQEVPALLLIENAVKILWAGKGESQTGSSSLEF